MVQFSRNVFRFCVAVHFVSVRFCSVFFLILFTIMSCFVHEALIIPLRCLRWNAVKTKSGHVVVSFPCPSVFTINCSLVQSLFCISWSLLLKYFVNNFELADYFDFYFELGPFYSTFSSVTAFNCGCFWNFFVLFLPTANIAKHFHLFAPNSRMLQQTARSKWHFKWIEATRTE